MIICLQGIIFNKYPEKKSSDQRVQGLSELCQEGGKYYDKLFIHAGISSDRLTMASIEATKMKKGKEKIKINPGQMTGIIKKLGKYWGASDLGITKLRSYHFYSHAGRQSRNWGEKITNKHSYAIAIIIAMKVEMIKQAPTLPIIIESMSKYLETAKIAHQIANYIKGLGYDALAHFDANYQLACVPVARDAGMGEVGCTQSLVLA